MGVDLTLMPLMSKDFWASHDLLRLERRSEFWPEIAKIEKAEVPQPVYCYVARGQDGEAKYGELSETPYGTPLPWTTVGALLELKDHECVQEHRLNRAVWKYLSELPPDLPVALYWH